MLRRYLVLGAVSMIACALQAQEPKNANGKQTQNQQVNGNVAEKDAIILRNQIDNTDVYAIPYDDSQTEDEMELDQLEGKPYTPPR